MNEVMATIAWVVASLIAGWIAGVSMKGGGYGRAGDVAVGVVGAFAGAILLAFVMNTDQPNYVAASVIVAVISAAAFVAIARFVTRRTTRTIDVAPPAPTTVP